MLTRADAGGYAVRRERVYLDELVRECARSVDAVARQRRVQVSVSAPDELACDVDEPLVRRMLMNLLLNAVQHAREGGRVLLDVRVTDGVGEFRVSDDGAGVPAAEQERIFEQIGRAHVGTPVTSLSRMPASA